MTTGTEPGNDYKPAFTVLTATYNRVHTLHRPYESLRAQTFRDFEWLVIDDGSTDGTRAVVERWKQEADFPIRYLSQPNSGVHVSWNRGLREANGEFFLRLDSDDACVPHALERLKHHWDDIPDEQKPGFSAVSVLCVDQLGRPVGSRFPHDPTDSDSLEIFYRHKVTGEKWGFHRTDVARNYEFPELADCFVTESVVWNQIARSYKTRFVNEPLKIYYTEPAEDSLTKRAADVEDRAPMFAFSNRLTLNDDLDWFRAAPMRFLKTAANYTRYSLHAGAGMGAQFQELDNAGARALYVLTLPLGLVLYARDRLRRGAGRQRVRVLATGGLPVRAGVRTGSPEERS